MRQAVLFLLQPPLDDEFGNKAQKAHTKAQKNHKGAELARLRLSGQVANDEHHEQDKGRHPVGEEKLRQLLFGEAKNHVIHSQAGRPKLLI